MWANLIYFIVVTWFMLPNIFERSICGSLVTLAREFAMWCSSSQSSTWKKNKPEYVACLWFISQDPGGNVLYLTFACDQGLDEFYLFICMWPGVDDFLTKTGQRLCQCYMFSFCIFELLWIQMVKETGKTQKIFANFLRDFTCGKPGRQLWSF